MTAACIVLFALGCRGPDAPDPVDPDPPTEPAEDPDVTEPLPAPWEAAEPTGETVEGWARVELGSDLPGPGWFDGSGIKGHDAAYAAVYDVEGASWPVVQVRIMGRVSSGWRVLELDIAANHWVAGEVAVDGEQAVGLLTESDGSERFVLGGTLEVIRPGLSDGEAVEVAFDALELAEVSP